MEEYKILAMNFGSTSTKVAVYEGDTRLLQKVFHHSPEDLEGVSSMEDNAALRKPLQKELSKVEKELAQKNEELRKLSDRLADGDFYTSTDPDEVARVLREHGELKPVVEELEMRWLELSEEIEAVC